MRPVPLGDWRRKRGAAFFVFSTADLKKIILNRLNTNHGLVVTLPNHQQKCTGEIAVLLYTPGDERVLAAIPIQKVYRQPQQTGSSEYRTESTVMKRFTIICCLLILLLLAPPAAAEIIFGPTITGFTPTSGPNDGVVTITVTGTGYNTLTMVTLNKCARKTGGSGQAAFAGTVISKTDTSVTATFDLRNKVAGEYDLTIIAPWEGLDAAAIADRTFTIYQGSGQSPVYDIPAVTATTAVATTTTNPPGENSVYFETYPPGATIFLDGESVGTSPFIYYTNRKGTFNVVAWKSGYQEYEAKVIILEGKLVHFVAPLTVVSATTAPATTTTTATTTTPPATTAVTTTTTGILATTAVKTTTIATTAATPEKTITTAPKSTMVIPTPWPTDPPVTKKSPFDPTLAPGAAFLAIVLFVIRRR